MALVACAVVQLLTTAAIGAGTAAPLLSSSSRGWKASLAAKLQPHGVVLLLQALACLQWLLPSRSLAPVQAAVSAAGNGWLLKQVLQSALGARKLDKSALLQPQMVEVAMAVMALLLGTFKAQLPVGLAMAVAASSLVFQRWSILQRPSGIMRMVDAQKARAASRTDVWHPALLWILHGYRWARAVHLLACCLVGTGVLPGSDSHLSAAAQVVWMAASLMAVVALPQAMLMHLALTQHTLLVVARHVDGKQKADSTAQRSAQPVSSAADTGYCVELQQLLDCDATVSHEGEVGMRQLDTLLASCLSGIPEGDEAALLNTIRSEGGMSDILSSRGLIHKSEDSHTHPMHSTHTPGEPPRLSFDLVNRLAPRTSEALRMPQSKVTSALLSVGTQTEDTPRGSVDRGSSSSRRSIGFLNTMAEQLASGTQSDAAAGAAATLTSRAATAANKAAALLAGPPAGGGAVDLSWQQVLLAAREHASHIAHDLKNPLNGVLALSQTIAQGTFGDLPQTCATQLEVVRACAFQLLNMINMLRDLMRGLNHGDMGLHAGECMVTDHINEAISRLQPMAAGTLNVQNLTQPSDRVVADNDHLYQVVHVVVANAFKFTRRGGVTFQVERREGGYHVLRCTDSGTGLSPALLDKFNGPFTGATSEQLGLGLLMVKRMMSLWGGQLKVSNMAPPAKGAIVELIFRGSLGVPPLSSPPLGK